MGGGRTRTESCDIDMTPMIDVVFQLIIFFLVAIHLTDRSNPEIQLERGPHGARVTRDEDKSTLTVEIDNRGHVSISNMRMNLDSLRQIIQARHDRIGPYPLLIRGDLRTTRGGEPR